MSAPVSLSGIKRTYNPSIEGEKRQKVEKSLALVTINAGGQRFQFYRSTLEDHTFSVISAAIRFEDKEEYFVDVNGKIFESYIDPYLRDGLIPSVDDFATNIHFNQALIAARKLCLTPLVNSLTLPKGSIGVAEWKKYFGVEVTDEPLFSGQPLKKGEALVLIPKGLNISRLMEQLRLELSLDFSSKLISELENILTSTSQEHFSYWLAATIRDESVKAVSKEGDYKEMLLGIKSQGKRLPTLREALMILLILHAKAFEHGTDEDGRPLFCEEYDRSGFPKYDTSLLFSPEEREESDGVEIETESKYYQLLNFVGHIFVFPVDLSWTLQNYAVRRV